VLMNKLNSIKLAIFRCCESDNIYSSNILYRSFIEHYIKHEYIFSRWCTEKTDEVGIEYYKHCDMGENVSYLKALIKNKRIFRNEETSKDVYDILTEISDEFRNISHKFLKEKVEQFSYCNIIKYLQKNRGKYLLKKKNGYNYLESIIPEYSELSSFIHGGPYAEFKLITYSKEDKRDEYIRNLSRTAFNLSTFTKMTTYIFATQVDKKYGESAKILFKYFPI